MRRAASGGASGPRRTGPAPSGSARPPHGGRARRWSLKRVPRGRPTPWVACCGYDMAPSGQWACRSAHLARGGLDGTDDALVAGAAAEDGGDAPTDLRLGGRRIRPEEIERRHEHAWRAESALEPVVLAERLLERVELAVAHEPLDRQKLGAVGLDRQHDAGTRGFAVEQNSARAADAVLAADVRARQAQVLAEEIHEQLAGLAASLPLDAVHREANGHRVSHGRP